jgi:hypothetical protein
MDLSKSGIFFVTLLFLFSCGKAAKKPEIIDKQINSFETGEEKVTDEQILNNTSEPSWTLKFVTTTPSEKIEITSIEELEADIHFKITFSKVSSDLKYTTELIFEKEPKQIGTLDGKPLFAYYGFSGIQDTRVDYKNIYYRALLGFHVYTGKLEFKEISTDDSSGSIYTNKCLIVKEDDPHYRGFIDLTPSQSLYISQ